jgi:hypothetical protein
MQLTRFLEYLINLTGYTGCIADRIGSKRKLGGQGDFIEVIRNTQTSDLDSIGICGMYDSDRRVYLRGIGRHNRCKINSLDTRSLSGRGGSTWFFSTNRTSNLDTIDIYSGYGPESQSHLDGSVTQTYVGRSLLNRFNKLQSFNHFTGTIGGTSRFERCWVGTRLTLKEKVYRLTVGFQF